GWAPARGGGAQARAGPRYSGAGGRGRITGAAPRLPPAQRFDYLAAEEDRQEWVEGVRLTRRILNQPAMAPFNGGELAPGPGIETDEQILDWVAREAETALHPCGTCRMGTVVDPRTMRVLGLDGLRVVDASVFPY